MKADQIVVGATYWDREEGLRKLVEQRVDGYGVQVVRYKLLSGRRNGMPVKEEPDGLHIYGCNLVSFQRWAKEQVLFGPDALM